MSSSGIVDYQDIDNTVVTVKLSSTLNDKAIYGVYCGNEYIFNDDNTKIFRHPGYNVAYWNVKQRDVYIENDILKIDNQNLCIIHYSGFKINVPPEYMSVFQNRYVLEKNDIVYSLFRDYYDLIWGKS